MLWTLSSLSRRPINLRLLSPQKPYRPFSFTSNYHFPRVTKSAPPITSFRDAVARSTPGPSFSEGVKAPSIRNQIMFFVVGSFVVYSVAARQTNIETAEWSKRMSESGIIWKLRPPNSDEMRRARQYELGKELKAGLAKLHTMIEQWPTVLKNTIVWTYVQVFQPILDSSEGKRMCWAIGLFNTAVWMHWQIPRFKAAMMRSFTHTPLSGLSYTLLTSMFSHKGLIHLIFNCMALASFGSAASVFMVKEQNANPMGLPEASVKWHFLAFFVSAGLFSGLVAHVVRARFHFPRMVAQLRAQAASTVNAAPSGSVAAAFKTAASESTKGSAYKILPSLGASGAVYAAVTLTALAFPETEIALIFPPTFPIPIQYGVSGLVMIDILGALRGWRLLDHWAHLGGAAFGVWYYYYGMHMWNMFRVANLGPVMERKDRTN